MNNIISDVLMKSRKSRKRRNLLIILGLLYVTILQPVVFFCHVWPMPIQFSILLPILLSIYISTLLDTTGFFDRQYHSILMQMVTTNDLGTLPTLVDTLDTLPLDTQKALKIKMIGLLDQINYEHIGLLSQHQQNALWFYFVTGTPGYPAEERIRCAYSCICALSKVGSLSTLEKIRKLAFDKPRTATNKRIVEAAQSCLPIVEARLTHQSDMSGLLRASSQLMLPETLLRPASNAMQLVTDAPEQLLRAAPAQDNAPPAPLLSRTAYDTSEEAEQVLRGTTGQDRTPPD